MTQTMQRPASTKVGWKHFTCCSPVTTVATSTPRERFRHLSYGHFFPYFGPFTAFIRASSKAPIPPGLEPGHTGTSCLQREYSI
jgi:hypothetical protein